MAKVAHVSVHDLISPLLPHVDPLAPPNLLSCLPPRCRCHSTPGGFLVTTHVKTLCTCGVPNIDFAGCLSACLSVCLSLPGRGGRPSLTITIMAHRPLGASARTCAKRSKLLLSNPRMRRQLGTTYMYMKKAKLCRGTHRFGADARLRQSVLRQRWSTNGKRGPVRRDF